MTPSNPASDRNAPRDLSVLDFIGTLRWIANNGGIPAEGSDREARLVALWERRLRLPATERAIGAGIDVPHRDYAGRTCTTGLLHSHERAIGAALDVERLRKAIERCRNRGLSTSLDPYEIATEYARLTPQPGEEQEIEAALGRRIWPGLLSQPGGSDAEHEKRLARLAADATPQARATLEALGIIAPLDEMQEANREMEADLWNSDR